MMDEENKNPFDWFGGKVEYSRIPRPKDENPIDPEMLKSFEQAFAKHVESLIASMPSPDTTAKQELRIHDILVVKYRGKAMKPQLVIVGLGDVLALSRALRKSGASFKRIRKGYWHILDKEKNFKTMELDISLFCEKGQMYMMDIPQSFSYTETLFTKLGTFRLTRR